MQTEETQFIVRDTLHELQMAARDHNKQGWRTAGSPVFDPQNSRWLQSMYREISEVLRPSMDPSHRLRIETIGDSTLEAYRESNPVWFHVRTPLYGCSMNAKEAKKLRDLLIANYPLES